MFAGAIQGKRPGVLIVDAAIAGAGDVTTAIASMSRQPRSAPRPPPSAVKIGCSVPAWDRAVAPSRAFPFQHGPQIERYPFAEENPPFGRPIKVGMPVKMVQPSVS